MICFFKFVAQGQPLNVLCKTLTGFPCHKRKSVDLAMNKARKVNSCVTYDAYRQYFI